MSAVLEPLSTDELARDLLGLGLETGDVVLVHTSLRSVAGPEGLIFGGPVGFIAALRSAVGPEGTLVMPAFTADYSEPSLWQNPPVPEASWPRIRAEWPAFRTDRARTLGIGVVPETFRCIAGVHRSDHPQHSFCAAGPRAELIVGRHELDHGLGDRGPLGALYRLDARVLLVGCGYGSATALHLSEHRADREPKLVRQGSPTFIGGSRAWVVFDELDYDTEHFVALGEAYDGSGAVQHGLVGRAHTRLLPLRGLVDFGARYLASL